MKKNNKVIIICTIATFAILTILILYKTDVLKTKEMLFWKYMLKQKEQIEQIVSSQEIQEFESSIKKSGYIKEGKISIKSKYDLIKPIDINIKETADNLQKKKNTEISTIYNKQNIAEMNIITDNDYFLVKCEKIYDKYIGFENKNLKQLAKKIGITNTGFIPDKIENVDYYELFSITDKQKANFILEYIPIFRKHIKNKQYLKENNVKNNQQDEEISIYTLNISEKELNGLMIDILNKILEDNVMLEFLQSKLKIINKNNAYNNINEIKKQIKITIQDLEEKDASEEHIVTIKIYRDQKDIIKTEFIFKNCRTISVTPDKNNNKIIIKQYNVEENDIELSDIAGIAKTVLNNISEIDYTKIVEDERKSRVEISMICNIGMEKITIDYTYMIEIKDDLEHIDGKNDVDFTELNEHIYKRILDNMVLQYIEL